MPMMEYTDISVLDTNYTYLQSGTGDADGDPNHLTYLECGAFTGKRPEVGKTYHINAQCGQWNLSKNMQCSFSGPQSRFRVM